MIVQDLTPCFRSKPDIYDALGFKVRAAYPTWLMNYKVLNL